MNDNKTIETNLSKDLENTLKKSINAVIEQTKVVDLLYTPANEKFKTDEKFEMLVPVKVYGKKQYVKIKIVPPEDTKLDLEMLETKLLHKKVCLDKILVSEKDKNSYYRIDADAIKIIK